MKKLTFKIVSLSLMMFSLSVVEAQTATQEAQAPTTTAPAISEDQEIKFYEQLQQGIKKSQTQYQSLKAKVEAEKDKPVDKDRQALMNAATALEVKYTLYKNFYNTPSVKSPVIRDDMIRLFNKDFISLDDLTQLKKTVSTEKAKLGLPTTQEPKAKDQPAAK